jgi:uncharacterized protein YPO0396
VRFEATRARAEATRARVEATRARVEAAKARVEATRARVEATKARVEATRARVEATRARAEATKVKDGGHDGMSDEGEGRRSRRRRLRGRRWTPQGTGGGYEFEDGCQEARREAEKLNVGRKGGYIARGNIGKAKAVRKEI